MLHRHGPCQDGNGLVDLGTLLDGGGGHHPAAEVMSIVLHIKYNDSTDFPPRWTVLLLLSVLTLDAQLPILVPARIGSILTRWPTIVIGLDVYVSNYMMVAEIIHSADFWSRIHVNLKPPSISNFPLICWITFDKHRIKVDIHRVFWSSYCYKCNHDVSCPFPINLDPKRLKRRKPRTTGFCYTRQRVNN